MKRLKRFFTCVMVVLAALMVLLIVLAVLKKRFCPDREVQRIESPDGRYEAREVLEDTCQGALGGYIGIVSLNRRDQPKDRITLLETYNAPTRVDMRWTGSGHLEVVATGTNRVTVLNLYKEVRAFDVQVRIRLED